MRGTNIRGVNLDISCILSQNLVVVDVRFEEERLNRERQQRNLAQSATLLVS